MAIYACGVLAGLSAAYLIFTTTFQKNAPLSAVSVRIWGFRGPLGAFICAWGGLAMLVSAPFDDWWHNAYGLDVKIISPPHMVLAAGIAAIQAGAMLMALASQNRAGGARRDLNRLFLFGAGLLVLLAATIATEYTQRWDMHQSLFYQVSAGVFVFFLVSAARASRTTWPATTVALVYSALTMVMLLILPLFPGQPLLGPIYVQIDRFMPPDFPLLLVAPALMIDLIMRRVAPGGWRDWGLAAALAVAFVATLFAVQWPFAEFLVSPWARNDLFGSHRMDYAVPPQIQSRFYELNPPDDLAFGLPIAAAVGFVSARLGLWWGNWMSRVQR
jgi:hypothetical protein